MWKKVVAAGVTSLFVMTSTLVYAQAATEKKTDHFTAADWSTLTDARVKIVKAALQLTPDQEKYWPAVEKAIRARAEHRQDRIAKAAERISELRNGNLLEVLRGADPISLLHRRADSLTQRGADLKKLADAWEPLYQTLKPEQKRRMAFLAIFVLRQVGNAVEQRLMDDEDDDD